MMTDDERNQAARMLVSQAKAALAGAYAIVADDNWPDPWARDKTKEYLSCAIGDCDAALGKIPT